MLRANVIAQIVVLLSTPILSRLYSPEVFGQFAFFSAATALAVSVATFRFDWSIPNARTAGAAAALMRIGLMCILGTSLALITFLCVSFIFGRELFPESGIGHAIFLLPLAMISSSLIELFNGWYVRVGNLEPVGRVKIVHSLSNTLLSVLGGLAKLGTTGMIGALIVSAWIGVAMFFVQTARIQRDIARAGKRRMAATFRRFWREAALSVAVSLTNALSATASIFLIAAFFTLQELGWYALMQRLALLPVGLISASIGASFWATAAVLARQGAFLELRSLHLRATKRLSLAIVPIAIGCAAAPFVIGPLFGADQWTPAGYVLLAMAPQIIGTAIFAPTNHLIVYGKQSYQLASDIFATSLMALSVCAATQWNLGIVLCTLLVSTSLFLGYVLRFWLHLYANSVLANERK
jgi:O-antigen/teichoic acid export membrane protein